MLDYLLEPISIKYCKLIKKTDFTPTGKQSICQKTSLEAFVTVKNSLLTLNAGC